MATHLAVQLLNDQRSWSAPVFTDVKAMAGSSPVLHVQTRGGPAGRRCGRPLREGLADGNGRACELDDRGDPGERPEPKPRACPAWKGGWEGAEVTPRPISSRSTGRPGTWCGPSRPSSSPRSIPRAGSPCRVRGRRASGVLTAIGHIQRRKQAGDLPDGGQRARLDDDHRHGDPCR